LLRRPQRASLCAVTTNETTTNWRQATSELGLDPDEVRRVSERYDMHRDYNLKQNAEVLPLDRWYKWYRMEKLSEGHGMIQPPAQGCSISGAADSDVPTGEVVSEAAFLRLLELYRAGQPG